MASHSIKLGSLTKEQRTDLEERLHGAQSGRCFICDEVIDLTLHHGVLDIDHVVPLAGEGADAEHNFALTHSGCNRSKGAADLRVARRLAQFERLQARAQKDGARGANLGHILGAHGGGKHTMRLAQRDGRVDFVLSHSRDHAIRSAALHRDVLSGMEYFFAVLPLEYLHHDDRINPRSIGSNLRALIEEFMKRRPQLHVGLAWWAPDENGEGPVKVFDGQHKAAAQILLGVRELPVRVFVSPDLDLLMTTNTNAGDKLRQVAFDTAVLRHLGNTLYAERVKQYKQLKNLAEDDYSFSEKDLVAFFKGEYREMQRYVVDAVRDSVTFSKDNVLMGFVEWSGKSYERPLAYSAVERTFFKEFIHKKALDTPIDFGLEQGDNPRNLERDQLVRMMSMFANEFFAQKWNPETGGRNLESRLQRGEEIPEPHLRAWRVSREEILGNILAWLRLVIENYFVFTGQQVDRQRLLHRRLPEDLWQRIAAFLHNLAGLPCWVDRNLSNTVFGAKQNLDFWRTIFESGVAPNGVRVLAEPLQLSKMIQ